MKSSKLIEIFKQGNMVIPLYLLQHFKDLKLKLEELSKRDKILAIGEIGLDYYYDEGTKDIQKKWFAETETRGGFRTRVSQI